MLPLIREALGEREKEKQQKLSIAEVILKTTGRDIYRCPHCKEGQVVVVKLIPATRGSPRKLPQTTDLWTRK